MLRTADDRSLEPETRARLLQSLLRQLFQEEWEHRLYVDPDLDLARDILASPHRVRHAPNWRAFDNDQAICVAAGKLLGCS